jgi:hypothetical protein
MSCIGNAACRMIEHRCASVFGRQSDTKTVIRMTTFTLFHVLLSLTGIGSGLVVLFGLLTARRFDRWTALFLGATLATSVTGFFFPFHGFTPAQAVGILSLVLLGIAILARYGRQLAGAWGKAYVGTAASALYLNVFVLVVQLFDKIPSLKARAPTQSEPPFIVTQLLVLVIFGVLGTMAVMKFRAGPVRAAAAGGSR